MSTRRRWIVGMLLLAACRLRADGPPPGERAAAFTLPDEDGNSTSLTTLTARGPTVLVFYRGHW